jgi:sodium transport system ATP-binding protein
MRSLLWPAEGRSGSGDDRTNRCRIDAGPARHYEPKAHMIEVRHLQKEYDDFQRGRYRALAGISFDAACGEVFGLLGPNGAGKTTALRILSTVLQPSGGTAKIDNLYVVAQSDRVRHRIGFVSSGTAVYDRMTAWEMVEYFGHLYGIEDELLESRMEEIFTRLKMLDIRDRLAGKMSTGMKQKVSIARAIVHDPPVVILDEATAGLDVLAARAVLEIVADLRDRGKCIIYSTHIMREVERVCDRVAIMHRGHILATGTIAELRTGAPADVKSGEMEELFFDLIQKAEAADPEAALGG